MFAATDVSCMVKVTLFVVFPVQHIELISPWENMHNKFSVDDYYVHAVLPVQSGSLPVTVECPPWL